MSAVADKVEPVEVRAANLRSRVLDDRDRVEEIGVELGRLDEEIRAVTASSVEANPTGELGTGRLRSGS